MEFYVEKLQITDNSRHVQVDTSVLDTDGNVPEGRKYCNFIISYGEYVKLNLRVGDSLSILITKL